MNKDIASENAATYVADGIGQTAGSAALARKTSAVRSKAAGTMTAEDIIAESAPLEALLCEEDTKRRR